MSEIFIRSANPQGKYDRFSFSKLDLYKGCNFKFKLHYIDGNYEKSDNVATKFGNTMHHAEEAIANAIMAGQAIDYISIKNNFIRENREVAHLFPLEYYAQDNKEDEEGSFRTYNEKRDQYLEKYIYRLENYMKEHPTYKLVGAEQKFEFSYDEIHLFHGSIDRVIYDEATGKLILHDIKSWACKKKPAELKAPMQLAIYAMAAELIYGIDRSNIICEYDLPLCNTIQSVTSKTLIEDCEPAINKLFEGISTGQFRPNPTALCAWCQYNPLINTKLLETNPKAICPYACTWRKKGDSTKDYLTRFHSPEDELMDRKIVTEQLKQLVKN